MNALTKSHLQMCQALRRSHLSLGRQAIPQRQQASAVGRQPYQQQQAALGVGCSVEEPAVVGCQPPERQQAPAVGCQPPHRQLVPAVGGQPRDYRHGALAGTAHAGGQQPVAFVYSFSADGRSSNNLCESRHLGYLPGQSKQARDRLAALSNASKFRVDNANKYAHTR